MQHGGYLGEGVIGVGKTSGSSYEFHPNEIVAPVGKIGGGSPSVQVNVINNGQEKMHKRQRQNGMAVNG